jgi:hypothetical protein
VTYPEPGKNAEVSRILGMHDTYSGLDMDTFEVTADFALAGEPAGKNLAAKFQPKSQGIWELTLDEPLAKLHHGRLIVSVRDRQGNQSRIDRIFSVGP